MYEVDIVCHNVSLGVYNVYRRRTYRVCCMYTIPQLACRLLRDRFLTVEEGLEEEEEPELSLFQMTASLSRGQAGKLFYQICGECHLYKPLNMHRGNTNRIHVITFWQEALSNEQFSVFVMPVMLTDRSTATSLFCNAPQTSSHAQQETVAWCYSLALVADNDFLLDAFYTGMGAWTAACFLIDMEHMFAVQLRTATTSFKQGRRHLMATLLSTRAPACDACKERNMCTWLDGEVQMFQGQLKLLSPSLPLYIL